ncbi:MAG: FtsX-like permease family protein, partial [Bacteroidales bacterium]|nr:FtsX-like permease family protein [Bacteroidales bacterium]
GLMGLVGGLVGAGLGTLIAFVGTFGINNFVGAETPFQPDFFLLIFTLIGSFVIGSIAGTVPAINAAKQDPVEVLRG